MPFPQNRQIRVQGLSQASFGYRCKKLRIGLGQSSPGYQGVPRIRLRERIRAGLPSAVDGSIPLVARAWAVRGVRS